MADSAGTEVAERSWQFRPGMPKPENSGRQQGVANKTTKKVRQVIEDAVRKIGGSQRMVDWAMRSNENETVFWRDIVPRVLPKVIQGDPDNPIPFQLVERRIVHVNPPEDGIDG